MATSQNNVSTKLGNIRQVATASGVSVATVSRVMNGSQRVSDKTRQKVLLACAELGYVPNSAARALTTKRSRVIGVVIPSLNHSIFANFLGELERVCSQLNYSVVFALSKGNMAVEAQRVTELLAMGAEAFVFVGADRDAALTGLLAKRSVPFVRTSIWRQSDGVPTIGYDNEVLAQNALTYLIGKGHRRLGILHGPTIDNDRTVLRLRGIKSLTSQRSDVQATFHEGTLDTAGGVDAARAALNSELRPTALLCLSDVLALGALFEAGRSGCSVPDDISVMGFDDLASSALTHPELTTMALPTLKMGRLVAEQLAALLDDGTPLRSVCLPADIVERNSVRRLDTH